MTSTMMKSHSVLHLNSNGKVLAIIRDLDHVAGKVHGTATTRRYMNNEIWSLIVDKGALSWYITLSPIDNHHPLYLYLAGSDKNFIEIPLLDHKQRQCLIVNNPTAAARFFHFLVNLFIEEFLGCKGTKQSEGFYGNTNAYYGTVEQQGRLTLHLHILLWIQGALSPQEVHDRILDGTSDFQAKIVNWLEACHTGDFFMDSKEAVWASVDERSKSGDYMDPTLKIPAPPPPCCTAVHDNC
ncbi:hypothetical protein ARMGADRAFT_1048107 [Armillaria gallica]|uniref:Helitron helicase-like domain-containing protein n=1 Tax=Armillaria gallica TaxID=47427 RepID=A0A2H3CUE5_ARMGA|nr:hypothetical protein ARMGADRAFT_1048107 [Armillaria gallica]